MDCTLPGDSVHGDFPDKNTIGEGNGNPLQCSCLENPRDGGACWAAVYGVAQSWTRLKRLSSSSSRQEYWSGLPFPSLGIFLEQGSNPCPLPWQVDTQPLDHQGSQTTPSLIAQTQILEGILDSSVIFTCSTTNLLGKPTFKIYLQNTLSFTISYHLQGPKPP